VKSETKSVAGFVADPAVILGSDNLESLAGAKTLLAQVPGFLYLPVFVPDEVTGQLVQDYLSRGIQPQPFVVNWPLVERTSPQPGLLAEPGAEQWANALQELLKFLDHGISKQIKGGTLVLNGSSAARHDLADRFVPLLNQRREALRQRSLRLILVWPSQVELRQRLIDAASDLWSMRAASPMVDRSVQNDRWRLAVQGSFKEGASTALLPQQEYQLQSWSLAAKTKQADLSLQDALALLYSLTNAKQWSRLDQFAHRLLDELSFDEQDDVVSESNISRYTVMDLLGQAKASLGDSLGGLYWAKKAVSGWESALEQAPELAMSFVPNMANSLNNLSIHFAKAGEHEQSLAVIRRAVEIREKLAQDNFAAYSPGLASSLSMLSLSLDAAGERVQGLAAIRRAVEICEKLAQDNFATYAPNLAFILNNLSTSLAESGEREQGLAAIRRAVEIHEKLAQDNFAIYAPDLAMSLNNLANRLGEAGEHVQGLATIRRAVEIREKLAQDNFATYAPNLAFILNNLSTSLAESGEREQGLAAIRRAVEIHEKLAQDNFVANAPDLAGSYGSLADQLSSNNDLAGGLKAIERACELIAPFAAPGTTFADWQTMMHKRRDALRAAIGAT
jgi:N-glycosylase/DNA lyase